MDILEMIDILSKYFEENNHFSFVKKIFEIASHNLVNSNEDTTKLMRI